MPSVVLYLLWDWTILHIFPQLLEHVVNSSNFTWKANIWACCSIPSVKQPEGRVHPYPFCMNVLFGMHVLYAMATVTGPLPVNFQ